MTIYIQHHSRTGNFITYNPQCNTGKINLFIDPIALPIISSQCCHFVGDVFLENVVSLSVIIPLK